MDLQKKGFKKVFPDDADKEYFYWQKNIKHQFIKGLHVIVGDNITVYGKEPRNKIKGVTASLSTNDYLIVFEKLTETNLLNILKWLETPNM
jgi:hypothetical protein